MTTALIADDEEGPREQLLAALRAVWPTLQIVATVGNGPDAWDAFLEHEPEVCFLDIRMPGMSGLDVAQRIAKQTQSPTQVVLVTAFDEHALAAFDAGAVDYVLKPVDNARLAQTVARLQSRLQSGLQLHLQTPQQAGMPAAQLKDLIEQLAAPLRKTPSLQVLQASVGREVRLIRCDDVVYFESDARYTRVVFGGASAGGSAGGSAGVSVGTTGASDALIRTPLKELLAQLDEQLFWQVHRSIIVNHHHIHSAVRVDEGQMHLTLRGRSEKLPVSRHFQGLFKGQ
jgi:DNA-binding LytR/AlgR family response regulator